MVLPRCSSSFFARRFLVDRRGRLAHAHDGDRFGQGLVVGFVSVQRGQEVAVVAVAVEHFLVGSSRAAACASQSSVARSSTSG